MNQSFKYILFAFIAFFVCFSEGLFAGKPQIPNALLAADLKYERKTAQRQARSHHEPKQPSAHKSKRRYTDFQRDETSTYYSSRNSWNISIVFLLRLLLLSSVYLEVAGKSCEPMTPHHVHWSSDGCAYTNEYVIADANVFYGIPTGTSDVLREACSASSSFENCLTESQIVFAHNTHTNTSYTYTGDHPFPCLPRQDISPAVSEAFVKIAIGPKGQLDIGVSKLTRNPFKDLSLSTPLDPNMPFDPLYQCIHQLTTHGLNPTSCLPSDGSGQTTAGWQLTYFNARMAKDKGISFTHDNFGFDHYLTGSSIVRSHWRIITNPRFCVSDGKSDVCFQRPIDEKPDPLRPTLGGPLHAVGDHQHLWVYEDNVNMVPSPPFLSFLPRNLFNVIGNGILGWKTAYTREGFCPFYSSDHKVCFPELSPDDFVLEWGNLFPAQSSTHGMVALMNGQNYRGQDCVKLIATKY